MTMYSPYFYTYNIQLGYNEIYNHNYNNGNYYKYRLQSDYV